MVSGTAPLGGRRILVVEDDYLVAQVLVALLEDAGAEVVGPIGWIDEAIAFIEHDSQKLDGAVLDVNLHGKKSYPIADALAVRSVEFVFATGYDAGMIDGKYRHHRRCEKPFNRPALIAALAAT
jgi:CheY-like chemotaxis protein